MSTVLATIQPVAVGTNVQIKNLPFSMTPPDWIEVDNGSPFDISISVVGNPNNSLTVTPFEKNAWPITQLVGIGLQVKQVNILVVPSHYYSNVATENNSPTNICRISQLSQAEAQTNHYPVYSSRMNTTVATIANTVNNVGNPPFTPFIFAEPVNDSSAVGAVNIDNTGSAKLGDTVYNGSLVITGPDNAQLDLSRNSIGLVSRQGPVDINIDPNGTGIGIDMSGSPNITTAIKLLQGSISKLSISGPFTTVAGHITINHGLGATPDFIWLSIQSTSLSAHNVYWNNTNPTTLDLYSDATLNVYVLCIKF